MYARVIRKEINNARFNRQTTVPICIVWDERKKKPKHIHELLARLHCDDKTLLCTIMSLWIHFPFNKVYILYCLFSFDSIHFALVVCWTRTSYTVSVHVCMNVCYILSLSFCVSMLSCLVLNETIVFAFGNCHRQLLFFRFIVYFYYHFVLLNKIVRST